MSTTNVVSSDPHCGPGNYHPARVYLNRKHFSLARTKPRMTNPVRTLSGFPPGGKMAVKCSGNVSFRDPLEPVAHSFDNGHSTSGIRYICARVFRRDWSRRNSLE